MCSWLSLQGRWQSKLDGSFLSRETLLQVLARLDFILITALDLGTMSSALTAVSYDSATSAGSRTLPIEQCSCPPEYTGLSCESCSPGYYHRNDTCVPCSCNSRSASCDEFTGVCLVSACIHAHLYFSSQMIKCALSGGKTWTWFAQLLIESKLFVVIMWLLMHPFCMQLVTWVWE